MAAGLAAAAAAQTAPMKPDIPNFKAPTAEFDYERREVMVPMRDGVKLFTVLIVPKGAKRAPIILTRTPYHAANRAKRFVSPHMLADAAARRRGVRARGLHPRVPGRARQVRLGGRLRHDAPAARAAQRHPHRSLHRRLRHDRLAGEERAGVQRQRRHDRLLLRGLHGAHGAHQPAPGAQGGRADVPHGRWLEGR